MPLLGPGRAFFRVRLVGKDESAARFHSHSHVDEYYLILTRKGTLRYNASETEVKSGDLIGKPAGSEIATQLIADREERLRILDMELWHDWAQVSKDIIVNADFKELLLSGSGWAAIVPEESLITPEDFFRHYDQDTRGREMEGGSRRGTGATSGRVRSDHYWLPRMDRIRTFRSFTFPCVRSPPVSQSTKTG